MTHSRIKPINSALGMFPASTSTEHLTPSTRVQLQQPVLFIYRSQLVPRAASARPVSHPLEPPSSPIGPRDGPLPATAYACHRERHEQLKTGEASSPPRRDPPSHLIGSGLAPPGTPKVRPSVRPSVGRSIGKGSSGQLIRESSREREARPAAALRSSPPSPTTPTPPPPPGNQLTGSLGCFRAAFRLPSDLCPARRTRVPASERASERTNERARAAGRPVVSCRLDAVGRRCARAPPTPVPSSSSPTSPSSESRPAASTPIGRGVATSRQPYVTRSSAHWETAVDRARRSASSRSLPDSEQLTTFAHLSDFVVYKITNAKWRFHAPFEWGLCLKPSSNEETKSTVAGEPGLKVVAFQTEKSRVCWLTAMRLAKYGKQLRDNYRAFKNKQCEQAGGDAMKERYSTYNASNESVRSRVAMDFTGSVGRIVEDPKEAKDIAESEGIDWRRTWRPFSRPPPGCAVVRLHGLDDGVHVLQPWFHRGLKRDIAAAIVRDHGSVDGVFLVRESKSNLGAYVLTYKYSDKVFHAQIQPVFDERCNCWLYTLDKGVTKFYDLLQLIAFYQLNAGSLPTRLTHYVQNVVPVSLPGSEREASSSPPSPTSPAEMTRRFSVTGNPERFAGHGTIRG